MKLFRSIIFASVICVPIFSSVAYGNVSPKSNYHKTMYFKMKTAGGSEESIDLKIQNRLPSVGYLQLISENEQNRLLKEKNFDTVCYDNRCALDRGKHLAADRVITGEFKITAYRRYEKVDKYIDNLFLYKEYSLKLRLFDINFSKEIAEVNETVKIRIPLDPTGQPAWSEKIIKSETEKKLNQLVSSAVSALSKYYHPKKFFSVPLQPAADVSTETVFYSLSSGASLILPTGMVTNVFNPGVGFNAGFNVRNILANHVNISFTLDYYFMFWNEAPFDSFKSAKGSVFAGYDFFIFKNISILPMAGFGYHAHAIRFLPEDSYKFYFDPQITFKLEIAYAINDRFSITASPLYTCFFEKNNNGTYYGFDAGIKYKLN